MGNVDESLSRGPGQNKWIALEIILSRDLFHRVMLENSHYRKKKSGQDSQA